ncbi:MAG: hypothetical protein A3C07_01650 [Candidatus Sungbacteria bacterium RIFCSPHIGHO2_02_FULL_47_11]|uniref:Uncharacterized protein n=1 Tax=Candidatus Sungbacteria bacterium RIFCSPHIGHO2_02_FULL_47_11 TaxID=1802270 RepID=A0A1G2KHJ3_9BACT|nr:MAG: hypothetical protein A3C07_01650 [Candidatus Sungbacteria bacterium RIFCSPHIGHO2_02_FULL_47_11]
MNAAKEKLEIVSGAAPPPFRIFAGEFFRKNAFGLIQEYCTRIKVRSVLEIFSLAFAKESQWFWAIPNAPRFFKVRFEPPLRGT